MKLKLILPLIFLWVGGFMVGYGIASNNQNINDNSIKFEWEGLEKDIPKDGSYIQITGTNENIIYLNAIDE